MRYMRTLRRINGIAKLPRHIFTVRLGALHTSSSGHPQIEILGQHRPRSEAAAAATATAVNINGRLQYSAMRFGVHLDFMIFIIAIIIRFANEGYAV